MVSSFWGSSSTTPSPPPCLQDIFEVGRRYKIMNPDKMRSEYGKLVYMLMDAADPNIQVPPPSLPKFEKVASETCKYSSVLVKCSSSTHRSFKSLSAAIFLGSFAMEGGSTADFTPLTIPLLQG